MDEKELVALARSVAGKFQLFPEVVCAIVEQESGWNPWAMRYEPAFFERYVSPLWNKSGFAPAGVSTETEARGRATSWGLMQVMGQVARELNWQGKYLSGLCDPETGLTVGCQHFVHKLKAANENLEEALLLWNGRSNHDYPGQVLARAERYKS